MIKWRFLRFVIAGGLAACANFGSRILLSLVMPYVPAIIVAYGIGMSTAFTLDRLFVFEKAGNALHNQMIWFAAVNLAGLVQTLLISLLFARWVFPWLGMNLYPETIAHGIGIVVPVYTSYIGHKRLTFRRPA